MNRTQEARLIKELDEECKEDELKKTGNKREDCYY
jgi:hypothetical protein